MVWVKLDDRFAEHPKLLAVSVEARWAHVVALCYCGRNETDGLVPAGIAGPHAAALVKAGLWERTENGFRIHGFLDYNPKAADLAEKRARDAERMRDIRAKSPATRARLVSTPSPSPSPSPSRTPHTPLGKGGRLRRKDQPREQRAERDRFAVQVVIASLDRFAWQDGEMTEAIYLSRLDDKRLEEAARGARSKHDFLHAAAPWMNGESR